MDGIGCEALLDSGAGVSVTDVATLKKMGKTHLIEPNEGMLKAFENSETRIVGQVVVPIAIKCLNVYHRFTVTDEVKGGMTTVLGRDFLQRFGTTEFCWNEGKVRLGKEWIYPKLWLKGLKSR